MSTIDTESPLAMALSYSYHGWAVFPCHTVVDGVCDCRKKCASPGKHPRTMTGFKDATIDQAKIARRQIDARDVVAQVFLGHVEDLPALCPLVFHDHAHGRGLGDRVGIGTSAYSASRSSDALKRAARSSSVNSTKALSPAGPGKLMIPFAPSVGCLTIHTGYRNMKPPSSNLSIGTFLGAHAFRVWSASAGPAGRPNHGCSAPSASSSYGPTSPSASGPCGPVD